MVVHQANPIVTSRGAGSWASRVLGLGLSAAVAAAVVATIGIATSGTLVALLQGLTLVCLVIAPIISIRAERQYFRRLFISACLLLVLVLMLVANLELSEGGLRSIGMSALVAINAVLLGSNALSPARFALRLYAGIGIVTLFTPTAALTFSSTSAREASFALFSDSRYQGFVVSPNTNGLLLGALALTEIYFLRRPGKRVVPAVWTLLAMLLLVQTGSLTAMVATAVGVIVMISRSLFLGRIAVAAATAYALSPALSIFLMMLSGSPRAPFDELVATGRGLIWNRIAEILKNAPPTGLPARLAMPTEGSNSLSAYGGGHAHNMYLQLWLMGGWILLVAAIILTAFLIVRSWRSISALSALAFAMAACYSEVPGMWLPGSLNGLVVIALIALGSTRREDLLTNGAGVS